MVEEPEQAKIINSALFLACPLSTGPGGGCMDACPGA
jgi:hypothetical protein